MFLFDKAVPENNVSIHTVTHLLYYARKTDQENRFKKIETLPWYDHDFSFLILSLTRPFGINLARNPNLFQIIPDKITLPQLPFVLPSLTALAINYFRFIHHMYII